MYFSKITCRKFKNDTNTVVSQTCFKHLYKKIVLLIKLMCVCAQLCPTPCNPMDCHPLGSSVPGILQAIIPEWVAFPFSKEFPQPLLNSYLLYLLHWQEDSLPLSHHTVLLCLGAQSCLILCNPMDYSWLFCPWDSPGKNTGVDCHAFLQGIIPTQGSSPGLLHCRWIFYPLSHHRSP